MKTNNHHPVKNLNIRVWILLLASLIIFSGCGGSSSSANKTSPPPSSTPGLLSVSGYYYSDPPPGDNADLLQRLQQVETLEHQAGVNAQFNSYLWSDLEPRVGHYDTAKLSEFMGAMDYAETQGYRQLVGLQIINTVTREVPAELINTAWDDPDMVSAFTNLLDQLLPYMDTSVSYLSIGNEVDVYFSDHQSELNAYQALVDGAKTHVQNQSPDIKVGITVTAGGWLGSNLQQMIDLTQNNDVMITTYYPLDPDFSVRAADSPLTDFPALLAYAKSRPLVFQEVGYPSSTTCNSSQAQQAEFIHNSFSAWRKASGSIAFLNLFLLHDLSTDLVDTFVLYYGVNEPSFRAYLDSLGLRNRDNTDKIAWPAVLEEAKNSGF